MGSNSIVLFSNQDFLGLSKKGGNLCRQSTEIYKQRYDTWRYLDRLRYQMLQILVGIASLTAIMVRLAPDAAGSLFWALVGFAVFLTGAIINRISNSIRTNGIVLKEVGKDVGDEWIPDLESKYRSLFYLLSIFTMAAGVLIGSIGYFKIDVP